MHKQFEIPIEAFFALKKGVKESLVSPLYEVKDCMAFSCGCEVSFDWLEYSKASTKVQMKANSS